MSTTTVIIIKEPHAENDLLTLEYEISGFSHVITFDFKGALKDIPNVKHLTRWLALNYCLYMFNVDYPETVQCDFPLNQEEISFFEKLYDKGMREFRDVNNIPMNTFTKIIPSKIVKKQTATSQASIKRKILLMNGGGKDGLAGSILLEQANQEYSWFMVNPGVAQKAIAGGHEHVTIKRDIGRRNMPVGRYKGHKPTSAGLAFSGVLAALVHGYTDVVTSNEAAADEPNRTKDGLLINHQYTKSSEFEKDLNILLANHGIGTAYWSILRPLGEIHIMKVLDSAMPDKIKDITSCNKGFLRGVWCCECTKCAFVGMLIAVYSPDNYEKIWPKTGILSHQKILPSVKELLLNEKPYECVGSNAELDDLALDAVAYGSKYVPNNIKDICKSRNAKRKPSHKPSIDLLSTYAPKNVRHSVNSALF